MAREFSVTSMSEDSTNGWPRPIISRVAQLVASVPDKAGLRAPTSLSSQYPYACCVVCQSMHLYLHVYVCALASYVVFSYSLISTYPILVTD